MSLKNIVITRPSSRSKISVEMVENKGYNAIVVPTLELKLINSPSLKNLINNIETYDWLIFTSVSSIYSIFKFYPNFNSLLDKKTKIAVIGHKTKEVCEEHDLNVNLTPKDYTAEGLLEEFGKINIKNANIAIPRTFSARNILPEGLKDMGANVSLGETYKSTIPEDTSKIEKLIENTDKIDAISFTSPLTIENLFKLAEDKTKLSMQLSNIETICIGPITYKTLEKYNVKSYYPKIYTVKDMLNLLFEKLED